MVRPANYCDQRHTSVTPFLSAVNVSVKNAHQAVLTAAAIDVLEMHQNKLM